MGYLEEHGWIAWIIIGGLAGMIAKLLFNRGPGAMGAFWIAFPLASIFLIVYLLPGQATWDFRILMGLVFG